MLSRGCISLQRGIIGFLVEKYARPGIVEGQSLPGQAPDGTPPNFRTRATMIRITRKVEFSAAHFYHNPNFSPEENLRLFGKCNNPHGHGHNYTLEVTIAGEPDPTTGMVLDLKELKEILQTEVIDRMDHRHLNYEVPELAGQIPTFLWIALRVIPITTERGRESFPHPTVPLRRLAPAAHAATQ